MMTGIQRPLEVIYDQTKSIYIPRGINVPALNRKKPWEFTPDARIRVRTRISLKKFNRILIDTLRLVVI